MPIKHYPEDWFDIAQRIKNEAGWRCIRCDHPHDVASGYVLTVHHLDGDKSHCNWFNLTALCQRCHLKIQAKVDMDQVYLFEHSEWIKPYVAGWYAWRYLGKALTREEVESRMEELLALGMQEL